MSPVLGPIQDFIIRRGRRPFTLDQAVEASGGHTRRQCLRALDKLTREGYLAEIADTPVPPGPGESGPPRQNPTWHLIPGRRISARRRKEAPPTTFRDRLWRLIRMRRQFTRSALQSLSGASGATVEQYTRMLERHGYIRRIAKEGKEKLYLLCKDVGPKRPKGMEAADGR